MLFGLFLPPPLDVSPYSAFFARFCFQDLLSGSAAVSGPWQAFCPGSAPCPQLERRNRDAVVNTANVSLLN
eukprot:m.259028 g.259028  ORF g.259028 m.259028 type:complete len:71 (-) comp15973_c0_seq6:68-280(-)